MDNEDFMSALEELGVHSYISGNSIRVQDCPECEKSKYTVLMKIGGESKFLLGKCVSGSCNQGFSSYSILKKFGMEKGDIDYYHGFNPVEDLNRVFSQEVENKSKPKQEKYIDKNISIFSNINDNINHPISKYAIGRGWSEKSSLYIMSDQPNDAVIFVCRDWRTNEVIGYQRRYIKPLPGEPKTKTSVGFQVNKNIMFFDNNDHSKPLVICEGPFTALSAFNWGFNAVCTFGSAASRDQLLNIMDLYKTKDFSGLLVAKEYDSAGEKYYKSIKNFFNFEGIDVKVIVPEVGEDLNDSWQENKGFEIKESEVISDFNNFF